MPTPATAKWPRPRSEDEWEDMVLDAVRIRWRDPNAQRNGRRGQRQHGVDVFGRVGGETVGAQSKNTDSLTEAEVRAEVTEATQFKPMLGAFYLVVGGSRDEKLQEFVRLLSVERMTRGEFAVHILFFEDVCHELASQHDLVQKYWGAFLGLTGLADALSTALISPVLTTGDAIERIGELDALNQLASYLEAHSNGEVHAHFHVDKAPKLDAPIGSEERAWHITIAESHETHLVPLCYVTVDVDTGRLSFYSVVEDRWLTRDEWLQTTWWFN